jgi:CheY-like chemotaxis protein
MTRLLIVEDQAKDLHEAADLARSMGFQLVDARTSIEDAKALLQKGLQGSVPLPDIIVLDLDLGYESGFELMRFWHTNRRLSEIPIVVWSVMEDRRAICRLFRVDAFVCKTDGLPALHAALSRLTKAAS